MAHALLALRSRLALVVLPLALVACVDDELSGPPDDEPGAAVDGQGVVAAAPPAPGLPSTSGTTDVASGEPDCHRASAVPSWTGQASVRRRGAAVDETVAATVRWWHASTSACLDKYRAAGTVTFKVHDGCSALAPAVVEVELTDALLVIDRSTAPPTYWMSGATRWPSTRRCGDVTTAGEAGGSWVAGAGLAARDAAVLSGAVEHDGWSVAWSFARDDAPVAPPGTACARPPVERWDGVAGTTAGAWTQVSWQRYQTDGCVDRYKPAGVALSPGRTPGCVFDLWDPPTAAIGPDDGLLEIDRSMDPPAYRLVGGTWWSGVRTCIHADNTVEMTTGALGGDWAAYHGRFERDRIAARADLGADQYLWTLTAGP